MTDAGIAALFAGSYQAAAEALADSLALNQGRDPWTRSRALWGLVRWLTGSPGEAASLQREALWAMREVDNRSGVALCVEALAWLAASQGRWEPAAVVGAAEAVWRSIPAQPPAPVRPYRDDCMDAARRALGEPRWEERYREGLPLTRAQVVALALGEAAATPPGLQRQPPGPAGSPLTRRQREVAALVVEGLHHTEHKLEAPRVGRFSAER